MMISSGDAPSGRSSWFGDGHWIAGRNSPAPGELRGQQIASTGLGLRLAYERNLTLRADWGYVLNAGGLQGEGDSLVHFRFSYIF